MNKTSMKLQALICRVTDNNYTITVRNTHTNELVATHYCTNYRSPIHLPECTDVNNIGINLIHNDYITSTIWVNSVIRRIL